MRLRPALVPTAMNASGHGEFVSLPRTLDPYPLCGLLFCRCGATFCRSESPDAIRGYMTACGCRLWPIDAETIEQRVYADVTMLESARTADGQTDTTARLLTDRYARIEVGGTINDVRFVPRI